jgi:hypothetical protein
VILELEGGLCAGRLEGRFALAVVLELDDEALLGEARPSERVSLSLSVLISPASPHAANPIEPRESRRATWSSFFM